MIAAFAKWEDRIAPVFDNTRTIHMVEVAEGDVIGKRDEHLPDELPVQKALRLAELGITTLVCGAISRPLYELIGAYGIRVVPFVAGNVAEIIRAWLRGELDTGLYAMPGCFERGQGRFRGRQVANEISKENRVMSPNDRTGQGRGGGGSGRGGGQGRGSGRGRGQREKGRGRMGGQMASGPQGDCMCPACGHREPHERGLPCLERACPKCGAAMVRE